MHQQAIVLGIFQQKPYTYPLIEWVQKYGFPRKTPNKTEFFLSPSVEFPKIRQLLSEKSKNPDHNPCGKPTQVSLSHLSEAGAGAGLMRWQSCRSGRIRYMVKPT